MSNILDKNKLEYENVLTIHEIIPMLPTDNHCDVMAQERANCYPPGHWSEGYDLGYSTALKHFKEELESLAENNQKQTPTVVR